MHLCDTSSPEEFLIMHSSTLYKEWQEGQQTNFFKELLVDPATFQADCTFFGKFNIKALGIMAIVLRVGKNIEKRAKGHSLHCLILERLTGTSKGKMCKV